MDRRDFLSALAVSAVAERVVPLEAQERQAPQIGERLPAEAAIPPGRSHRVVWGRNGAVATADELASMAGVQILMKGGNAIDAIVAAAAALNVVEPYMSGVGGFGGYLLIYTAADKKVRALDGIGTSPAAANLNNITEADCREGFKASIVPGNFGLWAEALAKHGTMKLADVFAPAIDLAENGFPVSHYDASTIARSAARLAKFPTTAKIFLPGDAPPREGQILKQRDLARTFHRLVQEGPDVLYHGSLGREIVSFMRAHGGLLTEQDFAGFKVRWREPIHTDWQGHELYGMPPGSCSLTMFQMLNILEGFDLKSLDPFDTRFAHLWLESAKLAFLDDDRYNTGKNVEIPVERLISKEYAASQRAKIASDRVSDFPGPELLTVGTTHLSAGDRWGNVASLTQSLVDGFGCGVVAGETGIVMNNGLRVGFLLDPQSANALAPSEHAKGVMCPTIVLKNGNAIMGVGGAGGFTIPQTVAQVILKTLVWDFDIQEAISSPRVLINRDGRPPVRENASTYLEEGFPAKAAAGLKALGHKLVAPGNAGAVQGVVVHADTGAVGAGSDPRRDGHAIAW